MRAISLTDTDDYQEALVAALTVYCERKLQPFKLVQWYNSRDSRYHGHAHKPVCNYFEAEHSAAAQTGGVDFVDITQAHSCFSDIIFSSMWSTLWHK